MWHWDREASGKTFVRSQITPPVTAHSEANVWSQPETTESVEQSQTTAFDDDVCTLGGVGRADLSSCAREHHR